MKLSDYLQELYAQIGSANESPASSYKLGPEILKLIGVKERLLMCEEFKNTKEIIIMNSPIEELTIGDVQKAYYTQIVKLTEDIKFKEKVYLYSIQLTAPIKEFNSFKESIKDNICYFYDCDNSYLSFNINKSDLCYMKESYKGDGSWEDEIILNFKKALNNPEEYRGKSKRFILMTLLYGESVEYEECYNSKLMHVII